MGDRRAEQGNALAALVAGIHLVQVAIIRFDGLDHLQEVLLQALADLGVVVVIVVLELDEQHGDFAVLVDEAGLAIGQAGGDAGMDVGRGCLGSQRRKIAQLWQRLGMRRVRQRLHHAVAIPLLAGGGGRGGLQQII